jgi:beta-lactam-binding protein with PASTA domain
VPDTEGMTQSEAADTLVFAGFDVTVMFVPAPPGQDGRVVNQNPEGGQTATRGSNVMIFVGQSP